MTSHPRMPQGISIESDGSDLPEGECMFQGAVLSRRLSCALQNPGGGGGRKYSVAGSEFAVTTTTTLYSGTTLHGGDGEGKAIFSPLKVSKTSTSPFRAKFFNSFCRQL